MPRARHGVEVGSALIEATIRFTIAVRLLVGVHRAITSPLALSYPVAAAAGTPMAVRDYTCTPGRSDRRGVVRRAVVDHQHLPGRDGLAAEPTEASSQRGGIVAGRDDHRHGETPTTRTGADHDPAATALPASPAARSPMVSAYPTWMLRSNHAFPAHSPTSQSTASTAPRPTTSSAVSPRERRGPTMPRPAAPGR